MKNWMIALALVAVMGFTGFADAKGLGKHAKGMHGKITAVNGSSITLTVGGKKNPHTVTVNFDKNTTITVDGAAGAIDSTLVGKRATIAGGANNDVVTATAISVTTKHHHKKTATTQPST